MSPIPASQVSIIAVGVENYTSMNSVQGAISDIDNIQEILVDSPATRLFTPSQFIRLINPDSNTLRSTITNYTLSRSAQGDVLIFYFSGHGVPVGLSDFGFCTVDTKFHDVNDSVLPFSLIKLSDLLDTLRIMNVSPVIIIDACYSGAAGKALRIPPSDAMNHIQQGISTKFATNYALLCSCSDRDVTQGNSEGGIFSTVIFDILRRGIFDNSPYMPDLYLSTVFPKIVSSVHSLVVDSSPQLYLGETIPDLPLVRNAGFTPRRYRLVKYLGLIVSTLWNNGEEQELTKGDILRLLGRGAYGNHRKLSLPGWNLLEDNSIAHTRKLTDRGRQFAQGEIEIPNEVIYDPILRDYIESPDAIPISLANLIG